MMTVVEQSQAESNDTKKQLQHTVAEQFLAPLLLLA